jgi:hypothetical protein
VLENIGAGEALRLKIINLLFPAKTMTYSSGSIFMLDVLLDVLLDVFASEEGVRTRSTRHWWRDIDEKGADRSC